MKQPLEQLIQKWSQITKPIFRITHPGHDLILHVLHNSLPGLSLQGRPVRNQVPQIPRLDSRGDPPGPNRLQIVSDVIHHLATPPAKLIAVHVCNAHDVSKCTTDSYISKAPTTLLWRGPNLIAPSDA